MRTLEQLIRAGLAGERPLTDGEMDVRQVANIIAEHYPASAEYGPDQTVREWAERLNADGWGYDCCYPSQRPYPNGSYTRVEGRVLSDDGLSLAVGLAEALWADQNREQENSDRLAAEAKARREQDAQRKVLALEAYHRANNNFGPGRPSGEELARLQREAGL
mgnify:CR=1 FL=1